MVQVIPKESFAGNLAKGFTSGLAEQLPEALKRGRLSKGIQEIRKQGDNFNSLDVIDKLNQAGVNLDQIQTLLPTIREAQQRESYLKSRVGGQQGQQGQLPQGQPGQAQPGQPQPAQVKPLSEGGIATPSQLQDMRKSRLQPITNAAVDTMSKDILMSGLTQDPYAAETLARQRLNEERTAQKEQLGNFRTDANAKIALKLQNQGLGDYKDLFGENQKDLLDQGEYLVSQGLSPEEAADQVSDVATELGKMGNLTKQTGSFWNMFRSAKTKTQELKKQRKEFEKYGFGEQFDNFAAAQMGTTPLQMAHELDPIKNEALLKTLPKKSNVAGTGGGYAKMKDADMDNIIRKIRPDDNLYALEYELRDRGYDVNHFKQRLSKIEDAKEIVLSKQQGRQHARPVDNNFLGDMLYQALR